MHKDGHSNREIARRLKRVAQTINNAIHSGSAPQLRQQKTNGKTYQYINNIYFADVHFRRYEENRASYGRKPRWLECEDFIKWADQKMLENKWSPDACVGYAKSQGFCPENEIPSTKSLYHWIDRGIMKTRNLDLLENSAASLVNPNQKNTETSAY